MLIIPELKFLKRKESEELDLVVSWKTVYKKEREIKEKEIPQGVRWMGREKGAET